MQIKKGNILLLLNVVSGIKKISFSDARVRDAVSKQLLEHAQQFEKDRIKILESLSNKDKEGKPAKKKQDDNEVYDIPEKNLEKLQKEISVLVDEEVEVSCDKAKIKSLIEKTDYQPAFGEVELIDSIFDVETPKKSKK